VYIGYSLDDELSNDIRKMQSQNINFKYINGLKSNQTHLFIYNSWAYMNTSINEGMSLSILEAMLLGVPCLVRFNSGNCSIVKHQQNGLIFKDTNELVENIRYLLNMTSYQRNLMRFNAYLQINEKHSVERERDAYFDLIKKSTKESLKS
jgi:glycosyltransferase involved in cell wall biosynthesis